MKSFSGEGEAPRDSSNACELELKSRPSFDAHAVYFEKRPAAHAKKTLA